MAGSNLSSNQEILQYAIENGIIDAAYVQEQIEMRKRNELLEKHPYDIWEGKNGSWYTYLPDEKKGRILKKRTTQKAIEDVIVTYYGEKEENPTVDEIYADWINTKVSREEISKTTRDRYNRQYDQCFSEFGKSKIKSIDEYDIEEFALNTIHEKELTVKGFSNFRTLIFGIFRYAKKKKYVDFSITEIMADIEISKKSFRRVENNDEKQVFSEDELPVIEEYLSQNADMINLGLLLLFKTGLRVGELSALRSDDIHLPDIVSVKRTEICYENEKGERVYEVRNFPKTEAGVREIIVPKSACWILKKLCNIPFGEYLFESNGKRIETYVFRNRLRTACKKSNIAPKSPHKVRKTYGTILIDENIDEAVVIGQMGHTDIRTTKGHYYKNRKSLERKRECINSISAI